MSTSLADALSALAALEDPKARAVNERHGDAHGVNLSKLRALAKAIGADPDLSRALWDSGDVAGQLLGILLAKPRDLSADDLDAMVRATLSDKAHDWLVVYLVKKSPHAEELRLRWL